MIRVRVEYFNKHNELITTYVDIHADRLTPRSATLALKEVLGKPYSGFVFFQGQGYAITKNSSTRIVDPLEGKPDKSFWDGFQSHVEDCQIGEDEI